jgi:hypothetical protein
LPDRPNPRAASSFYLVSLPITLCGIAGIFLALGRIKRDFAWLPVVVWLVFGILGMLTSNFLGQVRAAFSNTRYLGYATGSQVAVLALVFERLMGRRIQLKWLIRVMVVLQVIIFWWLLLSGPFYSFRHPWPNLTAP